MTTKERAIYLRQKYPNWTVERIAIATGGIVGSGRVRQILKEAGLPTAAIEPKVGPDKRW